MRGYGIKVGIIANDTGLKASLAASFKRYSSKIEIIMERPPESFESAEGLVCKIRSSGVNVLFLSGRFPKLGEAMEKIKSDPLVHVKIFLLTEDGIAGVDERLLYLSDYNVLPESDMLLVNTRICALCDKAFLERRQSDRGRLLEIAERILLENGFGNVNAGAFYLKHAVVLAAYNAEYLDMMSALYFAVQHEVEAPSEKTVEKCIRTVINNALKKYNDGRLVPVAAEGGQGLSRELFGEGKPTASKIIPILTKKITEEFAKEIAEKGMRYENYRA